VSVVVIGCNHRSTPLALLERMTVAAVDLPKALHELDGSEHLSEVVVLSTCNRIEVYAFAERFHGGYRDIREFLSQHAGLPPEEVGDQLYAYHDDDAVRHLFSVASGLDSAVVGEHEILGQVRTAWEAARDETSAGTTLGSLFRHALETGKRARTETDIARGIASVSQAAVALASQQMGGLEGRSVLVLGAGEMAEGTVKSLAEAGAADVFVANRTWKRATTLAEACGGQAIPLDQLDSRLATIDLLVTTTGAQEIILEHGDIDAVLGQRRADLLIVDVAVPRDVDPSAGDLPGVTLLDMDDLGAFVEGGLAGRSAEVGRVRAIVESEVDRYRAITSAREVAPLIAELRGWADGVRKAELNRFSSRLVDLDTDQRDAVDALVKGIVNKLLHEPTVRLKDAAGHARGDRLAEALRDLFDL
jgi:glutamyl-tRNA reductase